VIALDPGGSHEVAATVASIPMCIDFLPDGRLVVVVMMMMMMDSPSSQPR